MKPGRFACPSCRETKHCKATGTVPQTEQVSPTTRNTPPPMNQAAEPHYLRQAFCQPRRQMEEATGVPWHRGAAKEQHQNISLISGQGLGCPSASWQGAQQPVLHRRPNSRPQKSTGPSEEPDPEICPPTLKNKELWKMPFVPSNVQKGKVTNLNSSRKGKFKRNTENMSSFLTASENLPRHVTCGG